MRHAIALLFLLTACSTNAATLSSAPKEICGWLADLGLSTRGWKNHYDDKFGCSSPYRYIAANNIAYYATGDKSSVKEVKLVINVNDRGSARTAHAEMVKAASKLAVSVTGSELSDALQKAISNGTNANSSLGGYSTSVVRDDWPTGKGYEVQFTIK